MDDIDVAFDNNNMSEEQNVIIRKLVLEGFEQILQGKTKDFNSVCDRLEKKYT